MANVKITQLTADTNPASTDVLPFVDISADETKKVTIADLLENAGDGSAGAPAFAFDNDADTGVYRAGTNALGLTTGGTGRLFIDSSGNVGIGATDTLGNKVFIDGGNVRVDGAPSTDAVLQIRGDNSTSSATDAVLSFVSYANNQSGGSNGDIRVTNAGSSFGEMAFATRRGGGANTEAMRIDSSGRLGLGTSSPDTALHINSTNNFTIATTNQTNAANSYISFVDSGTTAGHVRCGSQGNDFVVNAGGIRGLTIAASGDATFVGNLDLTDSTIDLYSQTTNSASRTFQLFSDIGGTKTEKAAILADGSASFAGGQAAITTGGVIDIQSTTAAADASTLFRCGSTNATAGANAFVVKANGSSSFAGQTLIGSGTAGASKVRIDPTGFVNIQSNASAGEALRIFDNSSTQKITLKADGTGSFGGNLGVGTTSPSSDLDVFNTGFVNLKVRSSGTNTAAINLTNSTRNYSINSSGGAFTIFDATASSERLRLDSSGRLLIGTSTSPTGGDAHAQNAPLLIQGRVGSDADSGRINLQRGSAASADSSIGTISFTDSSNNAYARISVEADAATGTDDYPGRIKFQTTTNGQPGPPTTRLTIKNDGTIQLHNSPGIDFSQIQTNASGMSSELLDSYEEGTFTPVLLFGSNTTGITYNARAGFYVKIGKVVHAWVYINLSSKGSATGAAAISQFPFTSEDINVSGLVNWPGAQPSRRQNQTSSNLALQMVDNSINCAITDGAGSNVTDATFTNGTILEFALCYRAA